MGAEDRQANEPVKAEARGAAGSIICTDRHLVVCDSDGAENERIHHTDILSMWMGKPHYKSGSDKVGLCNLMIRHRRYDGEKQVVVTKISSLPRFDIIHIMGEIEPD